MPGSKSIDDLASWFRDHDDFIFTTHMTPDGDGLGSEIALLRFLRKRGKKVRIINCSSVPEDLRFLARQGEVLTYRKEHHEQDVLKAGAIVAFDLGGMSRLGRMEAPVARSEATRILVDHHIFDEGLFDKMVVDVKASSSAEITYHIIRACGGELDLDLAEPLYVGLVQDTGSFNYNSTSPITHQIAAEMLEVGVNPHRIWKKLNCQKDFKRVRLMGLNIARIELSNEGRIASVKVDLEFLEKNRGEVRDAFEVVNHFLTINGVEVGCLALQIGSRRTKFSLRSSGRHDIFPIARAFGGGGHRYAAGFTVDDMSIDVAFDEVMKKVDALVSGGKT